MLLKQDTNKEFKIITVNGLEKFENPEYRKQYYMNYFIYYYSINKPLSSFNTSDLKQYFEFLKDNKINNIFPDVCKRKPCNEIEYAEEDSCKIVSEPEGSQMFINSFDCKCKNSNFKWSRLMKKCIPINLCKYPLTGNKHPCGGVVRSISCDFINNEYYKCKCKSNWMGENCNEPMNICKISKYFLFFVIFFIIYIFILKINYFNIKYIYIIKKIL